MTGYKRLVEIVARYVGETDEDAKQLIIDHGSNEYEVVWPVQQVSSLPGYKPDDLFWALKREQNSGWIVVHQQQPSGSMRVTLNDGNKE